MRGTGTAVILVAVGIATLSISNGLAQSEGVTVYEHADYRGASVTFTESVPT